MAVIFMDGCDTNDIAKWTSLTNAGSGYQPTGSRFGTQSILMTNRLKKYIPSTALDYIILGFWGKFTQMPNGNATKNLVWALNGGETESAKLLTCNDDGRVNLCKWGASVVAGTSTDVWADGTWHWYDIYIKFAGGTSGEAHLWVDGYEQVNVTGVNMITSGTPAISVLAFDGAGLQPNQVDDVVWYNDVSSGLKLSDYPLTPMRIDTQRPSANVSVQFTPSAGTNWSNVNKSTFTATPYNSDAVSTERDLFEYTNMTITPLTIKTVVLTTVMQNSGTGAISANPVCISNAVTSVGTTVNLTAPYVNYQQEYQKNPDGTVAWVKATIDAAQFGYEVA